MPVRAGLVLLAMLAAGCATHAARASAQRLPAVRADTTPVAPPAVVVIRGTVTDAEGRSLPHAVVTVVGTRLRVETAEDGTYALSVPAGAERPARLSVTALGYERMELPIPSEVVATRIDAALRMAPVALECDMVVAPSPPLPKRVWRSIRSIF